MIHIFFSAQVKKTELCDLRYGINFQVWYPFEIDNHRWVAAIFDATTLFCAIVFFVYSKAMPTCMIFFIIAQLKIFHEKLQGLDAESVHISMIDKTDIQKTRSVLIKNCIEKHKEIIR